ncbi:MAG: ATP-binding protein [Bacteroidota bacterium]
MHKGKGEYQIALPYLERYKALSDTLHQEELSEQVNNLAAKLEYESELASIEQEQALAAAELRNQSTITIGVISLFATFSIMLLILLVSRKAAQKRQIQALANLRQQLIANVSHDLRTPITVLKGYAETLQIKSQSISNEERNKYLQVILNSTDRLAILISQLFEYSKLETKQIKARKEYFQLADLLQKISHEYQLIAKEKHITIEIDTLPEIPLVYGDIAMIERVIQNLIDNAIKFTPEDGSISVRTAQGPEGIKVEISDTGIGIAPEELGLIFNRHQKTATSNGAGLGLSIVEKLLEMHDSRIEVDSVLNEGTQFRFSLGTN